MVDESQGGAEVAEEEQLAHAVQHVGVGRETDFRGRFGQDSVAEAVEVADGHPRPDRGADRLLDPLLELSRGLDVVGQDQDLLGEQAIRVFEEPLDALDDDARLARPRAGNDHCRSVPPFDDAALFRR